MTGRQIIITTEDYRRLEALLSSKRALIIGGSARLVGLQAELSRAHVVPQNSVPEDVVTMNSTVTVRDLDTGDADTYTLVYPERADIANNMLSILAPIGTAILGYRIGDELRWRVPEGWRRLRVESVIYQPERAGEFHL